MLLYIGRVRCEREEGSTVVVHTCRSRKKENGDFFKKNRLIFLEAVC